MGAHCSCLGNAQHPITRTPKPNPQRASAFHRPAARRRSAPTAQPTAAAVAAQNAADHVAASSLIAGSFEMLSVPTRRTKQITAQLADAQSSQAQSTHASAAVSSISAPSVSNPSAQPLSSAQQHAAAQQHVVAEPPLTAEAAATQHQPPRVETLPSAPSRAHSAQHDDDIVPLVRPEKFDVSESLHTEPFLCAQPSAQTEHMTPPPATPAPSANSDERQSVLHARHSLPTEPQLVAALSEVRVQSVDMEQVPPAQIRAVSSELIDEQQDELQPQLPEEKTQQQSPAAVHEAVHTMAQGEVQQAAGDTDERGWVDASRPASVMMQIRHYESLEREARVDVTQFIRSPSSAS
eukprot:TRINITY_DN181_c0_g1_i1.p2 TRINITY_DN181_c0_g1~~TRINITY_DN181_c0_g1_i1.p2  ORF type:complete len:351 (+),score=90.36 TRINITY_DN181_c0_g1_i1:229-1281(+)